MIKKFLSYPREFKVMVYQGSVILTIMLILAAQLIHSGRVSEILLSICAYLLYALADKVKSIQAIDPIFHAYLEANNEQSNPH